MSHGDDDEGEREGRDELEHGGDGDRTFNALRVGTRQPGPRAGGDPDGVDEHQGGHHDERQRQWPPHTSLEVVGATDQPERGEGELDVTADASDALRPRCGGAEVRPLGGQGLAHVALPVFWYQATVSLMATSMEVPDAPNMASYFEVSSTNGSSNS